MTELAGDPDSPVVRRGIDVVMAMLEDHVPLALVMDLADASGPGSAEILAEEGEPPIHWWEAPAAADVGFLSPSTG